MVGLLMGPTSRARFSTGPRRWRPMEKIHGGSMTCTGTCMNGASMRIRRRFLAAAIHLSKRAQIGSSGAATGSVRQLFADQRFDSKIIPPGQSVSEWHYAPCDRSNDREVATTQAIPACGIFPQVLQLQICTAKSALTATTSPTAGLLREND